jgi:hypothetical protein
MSRTFLGWGIGLTALTLHALRLDDDLLQADSLWPRDYGAGWTTVLPPMVTAVCASSLPLIDAPVASAIDV